MITVLILNHKFIQCGTFQYANRIYNIVKNSKRINYVYREIDNRIDYLASLKEYNSLCPNYLLVWNCILWANACHHHLFDLGGWQINASGHLKAINKFKEQFGKVYYWEQSYPAWKAIGRKIKRWWMSKTG